MKKDFWEEMFDFFEYFGFGGVRKMRKKNNISNQAPYNFLRLSEFQFRKY